MSSYMEILPYLNGLMPGFVYLGKFPAWVFNCVWAGKGLRWKTCSIGQYSSEMNILIRLVGPTMLDNCISSVHILDIPGN